MSRWDEGKKTNGRRGWLHVLDCISIDICVDRQDRSGLDDEDPKGRREEADDASDLTEGEKKKTRSTAKEGKCDYISTVLEKCKSLVSRHSSKLCRWLVRRLAALKGTRNRRMTANLCVTPEY